jgi:hypothetical protein
VASCAFVLTSLARHPFDSSNTVTAYERSNNFTVELKLPISQCMWVTCHLVAVSWIAAFSWFCVFATIASWWKVHQTATWVCDDWDRSLCKIYSTKTIIASSINFTWVTLRVIHRYNIFFPVTEYGYSKAPLNYKHHKYNLFTCLINKFSIDLKNRKIPSDRRHLVVLSPIRFIYAFSEKHPWISYHNLSPIVAIESR